MSNTNNDVYYPKSKLWNIKEYWYGETAKYKMGKVQAIVQDRDGDGSDYMIFLDGVIVEQGDISTEYVNDFAIGIKKVEEWLIANGRLVI